MSDSNLFIWNKNYETRLKDVDDQHKYLVEQINVLNGKLFDRTLTFDDLESIFEKLVDYTKYHFNYEEKMMARKNLYKEYIKEHLKEHKAFINEVSTMYSEINKDEEDLSKAKILRDFLVNWLAFHILEMDDMLGQQVILIDQGIEPKEAYEKVVLKRNTKTEPLVKALKGIMDVLTKRNTDLIELKRTLEIKVKERTKELVEANKVLEELSMTDQLTKLSNRRYALKMLSILWNDKTKYNIDFSCLMLDADYFKEVNDNFGHDAGDEVLKAISTCILHSVRNDDVVCRLGGDEFFVICPSTDLDGAVIVANNIYENINKLKVPVSKNDFYKGSMSIGVACSKNIESIDSLMKESDNYVYEAKRAGKNCVKYRID